jgi:hypothetical protein
MLTRCRPCRGRGRLAGRLGQDRLPGAQVSGVSDRDPQAPNTPVRLDYGSLTETAPGDGAQRSGAIPCLITLLWVFSPVATIATAHPPRPRRNARRRRRCPPERTRRAVAPSPGRRSLSSRAKVHRDPDAPVPERARGPGSRDWTASRQSGVAEAMGEPRRLPPPSPWRSSSVDDDAAFDGSERYDVVRAGVIYGGRAAAGGVGLAWLKMQPVSRFTPLSRLGDESRGDGSRRGR